MFSYLVSCFGLPRVTAGNADGSEPPTDHAKVRKLKLREVALMCDNFSSKRVIGEGSFGKVYKGSSQELGDVAIKVLDDESSQGWDEWVVSEQGGHKIATIGWCARDREVKRSTNAMMELPSHKKDKEAEGWEENQCRFVTHHPFSAAFSAP